MYQIFMLNIANFIRQFTIMTPILGAYNREIRTIIDSLGFKTLPSCYHSFLETFGHSPSHQWFDGADGSLDGLLLAHEVHHELMSTSYGHIWLSDTNLFPIMQHAGYIVSYLRLDSGEDPSVWCFVDEEDETQPPYQVAPALSVWLRTQLFQRLNWRYWISCGQYSNNYNKNLLDRYWDQYKLFAQQCHEIDLKKHQITDPWTFHKSWRQALHQTDIYRQMVITNQFIPLDWHLEPVV